MVRLEYGQGGERKGPARELHGGSGYWSQDSLVVVLGKGEEEPSGVWVRWPGGRVTRGEVPAGAKEVEVNFEGGTRRLR